MSKGPGTVQRALLAFFKKRPFAAVPLSNFSFRWDLSLHSRLSLPHDDGDRKACVSIMRAVKTLAKRGTLPLAWKTAPERGAPVIIYRTDNAEACRRAALLCNGRRFYGKRTAQWPTGWKWWNKPQPKPWWARESPVPEASPPHVLGAIAAARNMLVGQGKPASPAAIVELIGNSYSLAQVETALAALQPHGT